MRKNTVLSRILLIFFILIVPWSLLSFYFLETANTRILSATLQRIEQNRTASITSFEEKVIDTFSAASFSDTLDRSTKLAALDGIQSRFERIQTINQIQESLTLVKTLGSFVSDASVYIKALNVVYNSAGHSAGSVQNISAEDFNTLASRFANNLSLVIVDNKISMLLGNDKANPTCIMEVCFSAQQMIQALETSLEYPNQTSYALQLQGEQIVLKNISDPVLYSAVASVAKEVGTKTLTPFSYENDRYYIYTYHSSLLNCSYFELIPYSLVFRPVQLSTWLTFIFVAITIGVILLFFRRSVRLIHNPLKNLTAAFDAMRSGDFSTRALASETDDFAYLYDSFNHMATELNHLVAQNYQQKILLQRAELRQLQAQINPHFLYNSFFLLHRIIDSEDTEQASQMAESLGIYFRYITKQNYDTVPLLEEMEHAKIYSEIQSKRFANRIKIEFSDFPQECNQILVPKLFLQPLIENAFKYGLERKLADGHLRIVSQLAPDSQFVISIEDNGEYLSDEQVLDLSKKLNSVYQCNDVDNLSGMFNIAKRLFILYQDTNCFTISRSSLGGAKITVCIPISDERSDHSHVCIE